MRCPVSGICHTLDHRIIFAYFGFVLKITTFNSPYNFSFLKSALYSGELKDVGGIMKEQPFPSKDRQGSK